MGKTYGTVELPHWPMRTRALARENKHFDAILGPPAPTGPAAARPAHPPVRLPNCPRPISRPCTRPPPLPTARPLPPSRTFPLQLPFYLDLPFLLSPPFSLSLPPLRVCVCVCVCV